MPPFYPASRSCSFSLLGGSGVDIFSLLPEVSHTRISNQRLPFYTNGANWPMLRCCLLDKFSLTNISQNVFPISAEHPFLFYCLIVFSSINVLQLFA